MISYLTLHLWQDIYEESQARVGALERQLAALQVSDDDDEEEEGADAGGDGDDEDGADAVEEDDEDGADAGDDDEEW